MVDAAIDRLSGRTSNIGHLAKMTTNSTARKPHPTLIILAIVVPLCSCATDERRSQGADRAGAAATTSAMVVALHFAAIERSELLSYLLRLTDRDPEHATGNGVEYSGPVWSAFVKASWAYKAKFNGEMEHLRANKASAK